MLGLSNNAATRKQRKRPRQSNLVLIIEIISAVGGAGAVITGLMYFISRFCWWAAPNSRGGGGRAGCGNLIQYNQERLADPDFIPPDIVSLGQWVVLLIALAVVFGTVAFVIDRNTAGAEMISNKLLYLSNFSR